MHVDSTSEKAFLVGDNPFHNISHLSQERARTRSGMPNHSGHAADLVAASLENGANGFMFSVSATTLSILEELDQMGVINNLGLYPIVPYAYEYIRLANQAGGIPGLAKRFAKEVAISGNLRAFAMGLRGIAGMDPTSLMKAYLTFEISRVKSSIGKHAEVKSMFLHEVVTDIALALNLDWLFKSYMDFVMKLGFTPGFNTGNFSHLVEKFRSWNIDLHRLTIAAPFNKVGFQMNPSRGACEKTLESIPEPNVIAISVLAAGYLNVREAIEYIAALPNVRGVAIGVSKESHARESFRILRENLKT